MLHPEVNKDSLRKSTHTLDKGNYFPELNLNALFTMKIICLVIFSYCTITAKICRKYALIINSKRQLKGYMSLLYIFCRLQWPTDQKNTIKSNKRYKRGQNMITTKEQLSMKKDGLKV